MSTRGFPTIARIGDVTMNRLHPLAVIYVAVGLAACATASSRSSKASHAAVPAEVAEVVRRAVPAIRISNAELKVREGRRYYDVGGVLPDGQEIEIDVLGTPGGWAVVEIQRDIGWAEAPEAVRRAAAGAPAAFEPARVIESRQTDGTVIYELFAPGRPTTPAAEIKLEHGQATVLTDAWPH
jgi:hypothetical protein